MWVSVTTLDPNFVLHVVSAGVAIALPGPVRGSGILGGVVCTKMGDEVDHRGLRAPYFIDVNASWHGLVARSGVVADLFSRHHLAYFPHSEIRRLRVGAARAANAQGLALAAA